jgi:hypothetical protein
MIDLYLKRCEGSKSSSLNVKFTLSLAMELVMEASALPCFCRLWKLSNAFNSNYISLNEASLKVYPLSFSCGTYLDILESILRCRLRRLALLAPVKALDPYRNVSNYHDLLYP